MSSREVVVTSNSFRVLLTCLVNLAFLGMGLMDSVRGPTLLDLKDQLGTTVEKLSYCLVLFSFGSVIGSFLVGSLLDKFSLKNKLTVLSVTTLVMGLTGSMVPYCPSLVWLLCLSAFQGATLGAIDTGGPVMCLDLWSSAPSGIGSSVHSIQFSFALGALLAPIIAGPFLTSGESGSKIKLLYPTLGSFCVVVSVGFMFASSKCQKDPKTVIIQGQELSIPEDPNLVLKSSNKSVSWKKFLHLSFVASMSIYFLLNAGLEVTLGTLLATFSVTSKLKLSRVDGSDVTAIFWASLAISRGLATCVAIKVKPLGLICISFAFLISGSAQLIVYGQSSLIGWQVGVALTGTGLATLSGTGIVWLNQYVKVTNRLSSLFVIFGSLGCQILPVLCGQLISTRPSSLLHIHALAVSCSVTSFAAALILAQRIKYWDKQDVKIDKLENNCQETH